MQLATSATAGRQGRANLTFVLTAWLLFTVPTALLLGVASWPLPAQLFLITLCLLAVVDVVLLSSAFGWLEKRAVSKVGEFKATLRRPIFERSNGYRRLWLAVAWLLLPSLWVIFVARLPAALATNAALDIVLPFLGMILIINMALYAFRYQGNIAIHEHGILAQHVRAIPWSLVQNLSLDEHRWLKLQVVFPYVPWPAKVAFRVTKDNARDARRWLTELAPDQCDCD